MVHLPPQVKSIAIFRALQLGDLLCALPAIGSLRRHFSEGKLTLIGLPWANILVDRYPDIFHSFVHFPGAPGLPEQAFDPAVTEMFFQEQQAVHYDLFLQMHGSGTVVNEFIPRFTAATMAGFYPREGRSPGPFFIPYPDDVHEIRRHLKLVRSLGVEADSEQIHFPVREEDRAVLQAEGLVLDSDSYVVIHPGARDPVRRWDPDGFAAIATLCSRMGYQVVLTGNADETDLCRKVAAAAEGDTIIASGSTSIGSLGALLAASRVVISNCTGVAHLAAALQKDSVIISLEKEPWRWAPLDHELHKTIVWKGNADIMAVTRAVAQKLEKLR